jgi:hypothetical protein
MKDFRAAQDLDEINTRLHEGVVHAKKANGGSYRRKADGTR